MKATFAAGCFWGIEAAFAEIKGVKATKVGYTGGKTKKPTYEDVCTGATGHAEAVEVIFDPAVVSYKDLLRVFWSIHDPTQLNRQGPDVGSQYRSALFYHNENQKKTVEKSLRQFQKEIKKPVMTRIIQRMVFYPAEEYHQKYLKKKGLKICH